MQDGIQDALDRVDRLAQAQERVREEVDELPSDPAGRREGIQQIHEQKDEMVEETRALERDLYRMQQAARMESREASEELEDAVNAIRDRKMEAKIAVSKGIVERQERESALEVEDQISSDIEALRDEVEAALQAYTEEMPDPGMEEALEEARELARGAESLGRRLQSRGQGQPSDQAGETGQPGEGGGMRGDSAQNTEAATRNAQGSLFGGATRGNPEPFTEEEVRQFTREFAQRLEQGLELREALEGEGVQIPEFEEAMEAMEALSDARVYEDLPQIDLLQEQLLESLKRVEFILRRDVEGDSEGRAALTGTDDVPAGFREMVQEYFRNLARSGGGPGGD
jgi:hypothetical protein